MVRSATRMLPGTSRTSSGLRDAVLDRRRHRDDLVDRPRLVRARSPRRCRAGRPSTRRGCSGRTSSPVARARTLPVATSSTTAELSSLAPVFATKCRELALHGVLQVGVERELQRRAGHRRPLVADAAGDLGAAALGRVDLAHAVGAGEQVVLRALQADAAGELAGRVGGVPGRGADDVRGERPARVLARLAALQRDLRELVAASPARRRGRPAWPARRSPCPR